MVAELEADIAQQRIRVRNYRVADLATPDPVRRLKECYDLSLLPTGSETQKKYVRAV